MLDSRSVFEKTILTLEHTDKLDQVAIVVSHNCGLESRMPKDGNNDPVWAHRVPTSDVLSRFRIGHAMILVAMVELRDEFQLQAHGDSPAPAKQAAQAPPCQPRRGLHLLSPSCPASIFLSLAASRWHPP